MRTITRTILLITTIGLVCSLNAAAQDEPFSVKEYNEFHHVLHPLEHEALPAKDFQRLRANAAELLKRGRAIVQVGMPKGTAEKHAEEFQRELGKFNQALDKFAEHSQKGTDEQLEVSFSAVHDSFEMLAALLPRKHSN